MSAVRVVDVHAHAIFPALQGIVVEGDPAGFDVHQRLEAVRNGTESLAVSGAMVGARFPQLTQLDRRLADMDAAGVDVQIVSPSPSHYYPFLGEQLARTVHTPQTRRCASWCREHPIGSADRGSHRCSIRR